MKRYDLVNRYLFDHMVDDVEGDYVLYTEAQEEIKKAREQAIEECAKVAENIARESWMRGTEMLGKVANDILKLKEVKP